MYFCSTICSVFGQILENENGCWEWQGSINDSGYGRTSIYESHERCLSHRLTYMLFIGEIPKGMHICHKCDNPRCCNPDHLFPGTPKDNIRDCVKKGRAAPGYKKARPGVLHGNAKLDDEKVKQIRKLYEEKHTFADIARIYEMSECRISQICKRTAWKHIP